MNAKEYVEELMLRLSRFDVIKDLNEPLMLTYINKGRQQAQRLTIAYMPERYSRRSVFPIENQPMAQYNTRAYDGQLVSLYPVVLPDDFLDSYRVILQYTLNNVERLVECRRYTMDEIYNTNILAINPPKIFTPIYTVVANNDINYRLLIAGLDLSSNNNIFADENYSDVMCEVWYTVAINELEGRNSNNQIDNELTLPIHIEELAINYAMLHCLRHVKHEEGIQLLIQEVQLLESMFMQNFEQNIVATNLELATSQEVK